MTDFQKFLVQINRFGQKSIGQAQGRTPVRKVEGKSKNQTLKIGVKVSMALHNVDALMEHVGLDIYWAHLSDSGYRFILCI